MKVSNLKRDTCHGLFSSADDRQGWSADVTLDDGTTLGLSKLDGETDWTADSAFRGNGFPLWCNGFGARYLRTKQLTDETALAMLDGAILEYYASELAAGRSI